MLQMAVFILLVLLSYVGVSDIRRLALRHQIMDQPKERSSHSIPMPRGGGVAIVILVLVTSLWFANETDLSRSLTYIVLGAILAWVAVAGGDTSSHALSELDIHALTLRHPIVLSGGRTDRLRHLLHQAELCAVLHAGLFLLECPRQLLGPLADPGVPFRHRPDLLHALTRDLALRAAALCVLRIGSLTLLSLLRLLSLLVLSVAVLPRLPLAALLPHLGELSIDFGDLVSQLAVARQLLREAP